MMKFINETFHQQRMTSLTMETSALQLEDVMFDFRSFLRGCGYSLPEPEQIDHEEEALSDLLQERIEDAMQFLGAIWISRPSTMEEHQEQLSRLRGILEGDM